MDGLRMGLSWMFLFCGLSRVYGNFNLYMNASETKRLLGIHGELYYVRDGILNDYALRFNQPIRTDVTELFFDWQSGRKTPPEPLMYYTIAVWVSNPQAMVTSVSVAQVGQVPTKPSVLRITLNCTGVQSAEVDIKIHLNVTIFTAANITVLEIRRKKTCLRANVLDDGFVNSRQMEPGWQNRNLQQGNTASPAGTGSKLLSGLSTQAFYIGVGCASVAIIIIILIVLLYYLRTKKSEREHFSDTSSRVSHEQAFLRTDASNRSTTSGIYSGASSRGRPHTSPPPPVPPPRSLLSPEDVNLMSSGESRSADVRTALLDISVDRSYIILNDVLMEGTFGRVYVGSLLVDEREDEKIYRQVIIKTVTEAARSDQVDVMLKDGLLMKGLRHDNISCLLAVSCLKTTTAADEQQQHQQLDDQQLMEIEPILCQKGRRDMPMLIYPHLDKGNLKQFLLRCWVSDAGLHQMLNTQQLVYMAVQLARAVHYLHRRNILHRDIATRNCLVDHSLTVQLTDNSLSRDIFPHDYHCLGDNENRPIKWLALEALQFRQFSFASDTWSFGLLLWELMTLGQQPYSDIDPFEMEAYLSAGYRVVQPVNCPNELFAIMACCWSTLPEDRPKLSQLSACLQEFYTALGQFV